MRTIRRVVAPAVAGLALAFAAVAPAAAASPEPWLPYPEGTLTLPAARYCGDFDLQSTPVRQDVRSRVLQRYPDGAVEVQTFRGLLLVEVSNQSTGAAVQRNLSGRARVTFREDGSIATYEMWGPVGMGWPQQDAYDRGFYVMDGHHVVAFDESGARSMLLDQGTEENLCDVVG